MQLELRRVGELNRVAYAVKRANTGFCGEDVIHAPGVLLSSTEHFELEFRDIARYEFGIGDRLTVLKVEPESPAAQAGLAVGDRIIAWNGRRLGVGTGAEEKLGEELRRHAGGAATLTLVRGGVESEIAIEPTRVCDIPVFLINDNEINAFADGENIFVTTGMLRFVETDDELALILGHELAHNTLGHIESKQANAVIGTIAGIVLTGLTGIDLTALGGQVGGQAFSQDFESEADYVGVYHAARAGYDVRDAAFFWRRIGAESPSAIHLAGSTHPSTAVRFLAVEKAVEEIANKQSAGLALIPDGLTVEPSAIAAMVAEVPEIPPAHSQAAEPVDTQGDADEEPVAPPAARNGSGDAGPGKPSSVAEARDSTDEAMEVLARTLDAAAVERRTAIHNANTAYWAAHMSAQAQTEYNISDGSSRDREAGRTSARVAHRLALEEIETRYRRVVARAWAVWHETPGAEAVESLSPDP